MQLTKKYAVSAGVAFTAAALTAAVAIPAAATPAHPAASTIKLCQDAYNSTNRCTYEYTNVPDMAHASGGNFQDSISYIENYTGRKWCMWTDNNYSGTEGEFQNNYTWNYLTAPYNDSISSARPC